MGPQDPCHLGGGAVGLLAFERRRQAQHLGRGAWGDLPRRGLQRGEPAPTPGADPAVQRLARRLHLLAERAGVDCCGQGPDQPAPGTLGQTRVGGVVNGAEPRLPNTLNVSFPGVPSADLVLALDERGVCISGGAACHSGSAEPTAVMKAMNVPLDEALGAVRFSLSRYTTADEIEQAADAVLEAVAALQPQETR